MTLKKKALEIVIKMQFQKEPLMFDQAKQCALIAIDEILKAIPGEYLDVWQGETNMVINEDVSYWERVKHEIEKL